MGKPLCQICFELPELDDKDDDWWFKNEANFWAKYYRPGFGYPSIFCEEHSKQFPKEELKEL